MMSMIVMMILRNAYLHRHQNIMMHKHQEAIMPQVYIKEDLYKEIVKQGLEPGDFANKAIEIVLTELKQKAQAGK